MRMERTDRLLPLSVKASSVDTRILGFALAGVIAVALVRAIMGWGAGERRTIHHTHYPPEGYEDKDGYGA